MVSQQAGLVKAVPHYTYPVSELYGPVCQGEGMLIGKPTVFIRLGGCDYRCSWCDSLYAVDPKYRHEWQRMEPQEIAARAYEMFPRGSDRRHVTLSGGNPAIHPCGPLLDELGARGIRVGIETQGSVNPGWIARVDDVTLSPKPPSSGNVTEYEFGSNLSKIIERVTESMDWDGSICLKVVAFDDEDYAYAVGVHSYYPEIPFYLQAGTDVGVASRDDLCDGLTFWQDRVLRDPLMQDVSVLPQLHAILKGHSRGI